jgi:hypothetical protein
MQRQPIMLVPLILIIGLVTFLLAFGVTGIGVLPSLVMAALLSAVAIELFRFFRPGRRPQ